MKNNNMDTKSEPKYICLDCNGTPLQFTGSGRSIQCTGEDADKFDSQGAAEAALKLAEETGGSVVWRQGVYPRFSKLRIIGTEDGQSNLI